MAAVRLATLLLFILPAAALGQWSIVGGAPYPSVPGSTAPGRAEPVIVGGTLYVVTWDIPNSKSTVQWATLDGGGFVREGVHDAGSNVTQFQTAAIANQLVVSFNEIGCVPSVFIASGALSSELGAGFTPACSTLPIVEFAGAPWAFDPASGALLRWNGTGWTAVGGDLALGNGIDVVEVEAVMVDGNPFVGVRQKS
ncbi:MAG: hypothetical protein ACJ790_17200, partial [Myxococcaceae bacterium]